MHILFKLSLLFIFCTVSTTGEEILECNLRHCGSELLNFEHFSVGTLFRKMELASFCVKNCTPPVVHEFFQSIIFSVMKRIPGHCSGENCVDKNRFVALGKCVEHEAWPLLQCGKTLIDLAHIGLVENPMDAKMNTTCRIVTETVQCIEESLQRCGEKPFQLVKEFMGDLIKAGIDTYCHPAYKNKGWLMKLTTVYPRDPSITTAEPVAEGPQYKHPQFVKGYRSNNAHALPVISYLSLSLSAAFSIIFAVHRIY